MNQKTVMQVYVGPEDHGCPVRFDHLFSDEIAAGKCVEMLRQMYDAQDIHMSEVPVYSEVPRFYRYMASVSFDSPGEPAFSHVAPTLRGRPFQNVFGRKAPHIACAVGLGASEEEALAAAYSLYELACIRGIVEAYRNRIRHIAQREEQLWLRARAQGKVTRNPYTREEEIDPECYRTLYDTLTKELLLDQ